MTRKTMTLEKAAGGVVGANSFAHSPWFVRMNSHLQILPVPWGNIIFSRTIFFRMTGTLCALLFVLLSGIAGLAVGAEAAVVFEAGGNTRMMMGEPVRVQSSLIQISLGNSTVLSATRGAEFLLEQADENHYRLHMGNGEVVVADLSRQKVWQLTAGLWLIPAAGNDASSPLRHDEPALGDHSESRYRQGFHFDDYVLLRQQSYLDSLQIPTATVNNWLANLLGNIVGH